MTFDPNKICSILAEVTQEFRKGEAVTEKVTGSVRVVDVYMMPHVSDAHPGLEMVDVWYINVGVDKTKALTRRDELVALLDEWPTEQPLTSGLSYITMGGELGSQDMALRLIAVGTALGFWRVVSPAFLMASPDKPGGITKEKADELAGGGFVMASGYRPEKAHV